MRNIIVEAYRRPERDQRVEVVERKGIGHPDTICDSLMNEVSVALCDEYIKRFGMIMHHNVDKGMLIAGESTTKFGGGEILKPMTLIFGDRATFQVGDELVPVDEIAIKTAKRWLKENLRFVNPDADVIYQVGIKPGSAALTDIFKRGGELLGANDTSAAVGYAPLTQTEKIVLRTEKHMNSREFKKRFPEAGEDIKVMGLRTDKKLHLTVALAFVDRYVKNEADYFKKKAEILEAVKEYVKANHEVEDIEIDVNALDLKGRGIDGVYLTVTGTCADGADCGQVGRGNRVNGIIPLNRPIGSEAAAGKNPVSHVGKIYNVMTHKIAERVYQNVDGLEEVYIWLLSQIGSPIDHPAVAAAQVSIKPGGPSLDAIKKDIHAEIDAELADMKKFTMDLAKGKYSVC